MVASPFTPVGDGLRVALKVTPKARRQGIDGVVEEAGGGAALKVSVTAPPEKGAANAAVIRLLAERWRLAKSDLTITAGAASRRKTLHVAGDPGALMRRIEGATRG